MHRFRLALLELLLLALCSACYDDWDPWKSKSDKMGLQDSHPPEVPKKPLYYVLVDFIYPSSPALKSPRCHMDENRLKVEAEWTFRKAKIGEGLKALTEELAQNDLPIDEQQCSNILGFSQDRWLHQQPWGSATPPGLNPDHRPLLHIKVILTDDAYKGDYLSLLRENDMVARARREGMSVKTLNYVVGPPSWKMAIVDGIALKTGTYIAPSDAKFASLKGPQLREALVIQDSKDFLEWVLKEIPKE